jgi:hypothetical protein
MLISDGVAEAWVRTITNVPASVLWRRRKRGTMICVASSRSLPPARGRREHTTPGDREMGRRLKVHQIGNFVFYDVLYEDNTRTSNRKVPSSELNDIDGDLLVYIEAEDRKIAEVSGRPRAPVKSLSRSPRR